MNINENTVYTDIRPNAGFSLLQIDARLYMVFSIKQMHNISG